MEEKERFSIGIINGILYLYDNFNKYNTEITLKDLSDLLNQQDARIKELEKENQQLKQSQKQLAIEELEKLEEEMSLNGSDYCEIRQGTSPHNPTDYAWFNYVVFRKFINNQIKSLKGEE
jgi:hypothetical protein